MRNTYAVPLHIIWQTSNTGNRKSMHYEAEKKHQCACVRACVISDLGPGFVTSRNIGSFRITEFSSANHNFIWHLLFSSGRCSETKIHLLQCTCSLAHTLWNMKSGEDAGVLVLHKRLLQLLPKITNAIYVYTTRSNKATFAYEFTVQ